MGKQLLRDDGVSGLLSATFGDVTGEDGAFFFLLQCVILQASRPNVRIHLEAPLTKIEHVSRLLMTPSRGTDMRVSGGALATHFRIADNDRDREALHFHNHPPTIGNFGTRTCL